MGIFVTFPHDIEKINQHLHAEGSSSCTVACFACECPVVMLLAHLVFVRYQSKFSIASAATRGPFFLFEPTRCVTQLIGGSERPEISDQRREFINKQILRHPILKDAIEDICWDLTSCICVNVLVGHHYGIDTVGKLHTTVRSYHTTEAVLMRSDRY